MLVGEGGVIQGQGCLCVHGVTPLALFSATCRLYKGMYTCVLGFNQVVKLRCTLSVEACIFDRGLHASYLAESLRAVPACNNLGHTVAPPGLCLIPGTRD